MINLEEYGKDQQQSEGWVHENAWEWENKGSWKEVVKWGYE